MAITAASTWFTLIQLLINTSSFFNPYALFVWKTLPLNHKKGNRQLSIIKDKKKFDIIIGMGQKKKQNRMILPISNRTNTGKGKQPSMTEETSDHFNFQVHWPESIPTTAWKLSVSFWKYLGALEPRSHIHHHDKCLFLCYNINIIIFCLNFYYIYIYVTPIYI